MSNSNLDNIDPKDIKMPVRLPVEDWDKIEIDNRKGSKKK